MDSIAFLEGIDDRLSGFLDDHSLFALVNVPERLDLYARLVAGEVPDGKAEDAFALLAEPRNGELLSLINLTGLLQSAGRFDQLLNSLQQAAQAEAHGLLGLFVLVMLAFVRHFILPFVLISRFGQQVAYSPATAGCLAALIARSSFFSWASSVSLAEVIRSSLPSATAVRTSAAPRSAASAA